MKTIKTHEELIDALETAKRATILARALTAEMDAEITKVKARFEDKILKQTTEADEIAQAVQVYASAHRESLLADGGKSCGINGHTLGWRDNGGAVKMAKGWTEKKALARLLLFPRLAKLFTRSKPSLDKDAIARKWDAWKAKLVKFGFRLVREEVFFVELDITADPAAGGKGGK